MKKNRKSVLSLTLVTAMILSLFSSAMASAATDNSEQANTLTRSKQNADLRKRHGAWLESG